MSSSVSSDGGDRFSQLRPRFQELFKLFPDNILVISQSCDNKVLVYDPIIDSDKNQLIKIQLWEINLDHLPLEKKQVKGDGEKLFRMNIELSDKDKKKMSKMPKYHLRIPMMPDRYMEAIISKGEVKAKTHIGNSKCRILRAFVNLDWIKLPLVQQKIPDLHFIDLYGVDSKDNSVKERIEKPTLNDFKQILQQD